jgi:tetratricopeptide (TPR) repeat protein
MSEEQIRSLRSEYNRLASSLDRPMSPAERAEVKSAIVNLFKRTEGAIAELAAFKENIRELVDRFKALPGDGPARSVRYDHIGASTYVDKGWSELAAARWSQAEGMLRQALTLDGENSTAQALLGWALLHQDRSDEALQLCLQVLLREPEQGLARVAVGAICLRKGILGEAIEHLTRAASRPGDARASLYANYWLGVAYLERDMLGDAVEFLRRAVTLGPNLAEGWLELGRSLWFLGMEPEAREAWTVGSGLRHSPHAARSLAMLETVAAGGVPPRAPSR